MKVVAHLVSFFSAVVIIDAVIVQMLLILFNPTPTEPPTLVLTLTASVLVFGIVVTNGPFGVLMRRFYNHHQEHADDIARWLKGLVLVFQLDEAVDSLRVDPPALNPASHVSKPPVVSSEVLQWINAHMKTGRDYKQNWFRSEFGLLVTAHNEFERLYREARKAVNQAVTNEVNRFWPDIPKSSSNEPAYFELNAIARAVWDCLWLREFESLPVPATVSEQKIAGAEPATRLSWSGLPGRREHTLGRFEDVGVIKENLQSILTAQTSREDLVELVRGVAAARRGLATKFETTTGEREKTAWRISRNRDVGGKCEDCPKFFG